MAILKFEYNKLMYYNFFNFKPNLISVYANPNKYLLRIQNLANGLDHVSFNLKIRFTFYMTVRVQPVITFN